MRYTALLTLCCVFLLSCGPTTSTREPLGELIFLPGWEGYIERTSPDASTPQETSSPPEEPTQQEASPQDTTPRPERQPAELPPQEVTLPDALEEPVVPEQPPRSQWIGEPCVSDTECDYAGGYCLKGADYKDGHCSLDCTSTCPDKTDKPYTFCIADSQGKGHCVSQCRTDVCRDGYQCVSRSRLSDATRLRDVCVPKTGNTGTSKVVLYIGDSQSSGTQFASVMVDVLRNPGQHCTQTKTSRNTVFSYAKVSSAARHWSQKSGTSKDWLCKASKIYTNGTATSNTTGAALCAGMTSSNQSIFAARIARHTPSIFLIQLGGNSVGFAKSYVKARVTDMLEQIPTGSVCFWVTPSYGSKSESGRKDMETWITETLAAYQRIRCTVLTSFDEMKAQTTCTSFNTSDGVHMTSCGSKLWGGLITKKLCQAKTL